ncbi:MAG: Creatininase [Candidatus Daviesbacteria bacterium GW2011_GWA1_41_61]|uniref:Creatininase n=1 Tax=Candidatus Daviesbacteria bacterium GW2011_GWA2_40_9 TaxID=1618424 RepID=A0A0G0U360_9BACT|nr:MAG: Creatininase [Candidatus Daviesbacteria bacterium GW2011_GWC1_40_9]KKR83539.1 MAG: Creatininase [Candidatus Daviesbacteria bacterium GW2011_GWA2_40_9]KKR93108.1 MAG: Creatininase [Candidatus Daviesbacteria bacterium GW2011_GWB1_41_15]KKS15652.1 MAG: Creatininase [Candidatus Daviesbacteria bacterium GW2011_GWA1_41_61]
MLWGVLTKADFTKEVKEKTVIIPIGAIEAHGNHLPVNTDSCIVEYLAEKIAKHTGCIVVPTIYYGPCETMLSFAGTITISEKISYKIIEEIIKSIICQGFKQIYILNGHGGNNEFLARIANKYSKKLNVKTKNWYDLEIINKLKQENTSYCGDHADRLETEIMLAIDKQKVRMELAVDDMPNWPENTEMLTDYSKIMTYAVEGYPSKSTLKNGKLLLPKVIKSLCEDIGNFL